MKTSSAEKKANGKEIFLSDNDFNKCFVSHCDLEGGKNSVFVGQTSYLVWGNGMIDADPLFVDSTNGDYHLRFPSPCRDAGDNNAVQELTDFEGDPRMAGYVADMGADEFHRHLYWTGDATPGGNIELKFVDHPWTTPVFLWLGSGVMDPPMITNYGEWHLEFPLLLNLNLGSIPGPDGVLVQPFTLPAAMPTPVTLPFQGGIGSKLTNLSIMEIE